MSEYAHPEVLVTTDWVQANLGKSGVCLVEVDVDTQAYDAGHIPGAVGFNWQTQLQDQLTPHRFEGSVPRLLPRGHRQRRPLCCTATTARCGRRLLPFKMYGHADVRLERRPGEVAEREGPAAHCRENRPPRYALQGSRAGRHPAGSRGRGARRLRAQGRPARGCPEPR
jgi:hypothetical protein